MVNYQIILIKLNPPTHLYIIAYVKYYSFEIYINKKNRPVMVSRPRHYTVHQEIGSLRPKDQLWFSCLYPFW